MGLKWKLRWSNDVNQDKNDFDGSIPTAEMPKISFSCGLDSRESDIGFGNSISLFFFCTIFYDDIMFIIIMAGVSAVKAGIYNISKSRLVKAFLWI